MLTNTGILVATLTLTIAGFAGAGHALAEGQQPVEHMDTKPGLAHTTIDGKVIKIEGEIYTVESTAADYLDSNMKDNAVRVYVGRDTKKINGAKKVGDKIRAEITRGGFANSIQ
ncbi:MAG TPA: hypothetical protein VIR79_07515 [Nitrospira sp.]